MTRVHSRGQHRKARLMPGKTCLHLACINIARRVLCTPSNHVLVIASVTFPALPITYLPRVLLSLSLSRSPLPPSLHPSLPLSLSLARTHARRSRRWSPARTASRDRSQSAPAPCKPAQTSPATNIRVMQYPSHAISESCNIRVTHYSSHTISESHLEHLSRLCSSIACIKQHLSHTPTAPPPPGAYRPPAAATRRARASERERRHARDAMRPWTSRPGALGT